MISTVILTSSAPSPSPRPQSLLTLVNLLSAMVLLTTIFVVMVLILGGRHRRRMRAGRHPRPLKDAWVEAGRRMPVPPAVGGGDVLDEERS